MMQSLILFYQGKPVYESKDSGLRPLVQCITACKGKYNHCALFDKVIGLAAARLIVYSGIIDSVSTPLASESGVRHLESKGIRISADKTVKKILNKDQSYQCPMEKLAENMTDDGYYREMYQRINSSNASPRRSANSCVTP
jgi:hypothetical protein